MKSDKFSFPKKQKNKQTQNFVLINEKNEAKSN